MIDSLWHPAIIRSTYKHFYEGITDIIGIHVHLQSGNNDVRPTQTEWCEIRLNGPDMNEESARCFHVELEVDILIESAVRRNLYYGPMLAGQVASLYYCFPIYLDAEETDLLGNFDLISSPDPRSGIKISQLGLVKDLNHERAVVTAIFEMDFTR